MSAYVYAVIPYQSGNQFVPEEGEQYCWYPKIPVLKNIQSELTDIDSLVLFSDFLLINTCYRVSSLCNCPNGYCWLRTEIYKIARVLGANEVWYVEENLTDKMYEPVFSFDKWKQELVSVKSKYVCELSIKALKSNSIYSYYHDDFSDILLSQP